jgi:hypothetical protein
MRSRSHGRTALVALTVAAVLTALAGSAQALDTGTISGRFADDGVPVANAMVTAVSSNSYRSGVTDENGEYQITDLPPGSYRVSFRPQTGVLQWAYGSPEYFSATQFQVNAGAVTTVDDEQLESATIQGRFVDRQGAALDNITVVMFPVIPGVGAYTQTTTSYGNFSMRVPLGGYRLEFHVRPPFPGPGAPYIQYAGGTDVTSEATVYTLTADQVVTVAEAMLPTGSMSGRFTDATGNPLANVEVSISRDDLGRGPSSYTDANGYYEFGHMRAVGGYRVLFNAYQQGFQQYAIGKVDQAQADLITIREGERIEVSDSKLPTGTVRITAREAGSGVAVEVFQANLGYAGYADTIDGSATIADVAMGTHLLSVGAYGYFDDPAVPVTVVAGQQTEIEVVLRPMPRIETRVVDAVTGEPVAGACLIPMRPLQIKLSSERCHSLSRSGASGRVMAVVDSPGWYQIFVLPGDGTPYGVQWLGASGGTGSQLAAQLIQSQPEGTTAAPVIKLDRAGSVSGTVTNVDSSRAAGTIVSVLPYSTFEGPPGIGSTQANEEGSYTLDRLGPYQWPLLFEKGSSQWSGAVGNRHLAQPVSVHSGQTSGYNFQFRQPVQLNLTITGVAGNCYVFASNAVTGDDMGFQWAENCALPIAVPMAGPQVVKLRVAYADGEQWVERWYGGGTFLTAKPVILPAQGSKPVTIGF